MWMKTDEQWSFSLEQWWAPVKAYTWTGSHLGRQKEERECVFVCLHPSVKNKEKTREKQGDRWLGKKEMTIPIVRHFKRYCCFQGYIYIRNKGSDETVGQVIFRTSPTQISYLNQTHIALIWFFFSEWSPKSILRIIFDYLIKSCVTTQWSLAMVLFPMFYNK